MAKKKTDVWKKFMILVIAALLVFFGYMIAEKSGLFKEAPPVKTFESTRELAEEHNNYIDLKEKTALKANEIMSRYLEEKEGSDKRVNISQEYLNHAAYMIEELEAFDRFIIANEAELRRNDVKTGEIRADMRKMAAAIKINLETMQSRGEITKQQTYNGVIEDIEGLWAK